MDKAWHGLLSLNITELLTVRFLADEYTIDPVQKKVFSLSCNVAAKDFLVILLLHYIIRKAKGLPELTNEWANFKELAAIEGYYQTFRKRAIEPVIRKYGHNPEGLLSVLERLPAKRVSQGDIGIIIEAFENVPALVTLWRADEEFEPDANILFDKCITRIFCTEDIVVLAGIIASQL